MRNDEQDHDDDDEVTISEGPDETVISGETKVCCQHALVEMITDDTEIRLLFTCPVHGVQKMIDPLEGL